jgi:hypothetical protein
LHARFYEKDWTGKREECAFKYSRTNIIINSAWECFGGIGLVAAWSEVGRVFGIIIDFDDFEILVNFSALILQG